MSTASFCNGAQEISRLWLSLKLLPSTMTLAPVNVSLELMFLNEMACVPEGVNQLLL